MIETVSSRSMFQFYVVLVIGTSLSAILGYFLAPFYMPSTNWDWISILGMYVGLPVFLAAMTYYYGWRFKKLVVVYNAPEWEFDPVQMTIDEAKKLPREFNKKNIRLVADSHYWMFFLPVFLLIFIPTIPVYSFLEDTGIIDSAPLLFGISFALLFSVTLYGAFKSTSNAASEDFTLPLIRETVALAKIQEKVEGVSQVRIILDKAVTGELIVYEQPRVLLRIKGFEKEGYIESWSEDLGAVTKVLCRLYESEDEPQVVWWWTSTDRNFRKYIHPDETGYYVKNPLRSEVTPPGVKDIRHVTEVAVALLVREYTKTRKETESLKEILVRLNAHDI